MELEPARLAARAAGVPYYADAASRAAAERDFGGLSQGRCLLVAEPETPEKCRRLIEELGHRNVGCTLRGAGFSQSGQSVAHDSVSLSTRRLDFIGPPDLESGVISVGAGATLRRVVESLEGSTVIPPVLPLNLDMTVGGLLSAGGIGATSHRRGPVAANVLGLDVVTGDGELRTTSRTIRPELFDAILSGAGQCGLITSARMALVPAARRVRTLSFAYSDAATWIRDQLVVSEADAGLHVEGFCWVSGRGTKATASGPAPVTHWTFGLQVGIGDDVPSETADNLLASLRPGHVLGECSFELGAFVHRHAPRFAAMVEDGSWSSQHPWFEAIVPRDRAEGVLASLLEGLPASVGDGHRFTLLDTSRAPRHFSAPGGARSAVIGVFPVAVPAGAMERTLGALERLDGIVLDAGGRRYLSGWLGRKARTRLCDQFGGHYEEWLGTSRRYDPLGLFRSSLFPGENRS